jgi:hypothetical protein
VREKVIDPPSRCFGAASKVGDKVAGLATEEEAVQARSEGGGLEGVGFAGRREVGPGGGVQGGGGLADGGGLAPRQIHVDGPVMAAD